MKKIVLILIGVFLMVSLYGNDKTKKNEDTKFLVSERKVEGFYFLYYQFKGPYMKAFDQFKDLLSYVKENNIKTGPFSVGVFYDNPQQVKPEDCRSEIGFMIEKSVQPRGVYKCRKIDGFKAISTCYTSMEDIQGAWNALGKYIVEKGLMPDGPGYEFYKKDSKAIEAECLFPIK